jgi:hypothetical protein
MCILINMHMSPHKKIVIVLIIAALVMLIPYILVTIGVTAILVDHDKNLCTQKLKATPAIPTIFPIGSINNHTYRLKVENPKNRSVGSYNEPWYGYHSKKCELSYGVGNYNNIAVIEDVTEGKITTVGQLPFSMVFYSSKSSDVGYDISGIQANIDESIKVIDIDHVTVQLPTASSLVLYYPASKYKPYDYTVLTFTRNQNNWKIDEKLLYPL